MSLRICTILPDNVKRRIIGEINQEKKRVYIARKCIQYSHSTKIFAIYYDVANYSYMFIK